MTLSCPLCSSSTFPRPGSDFRPQGRAEGAGGWRKYVSWPGQLDLGALPRILGPFLPRECPRAGRKEVGRGRKRGREKGWDRPQLGVSFLWDWPRKEDIWISLAERPWVWWPWLGPGCG